MQDRPGKVQPIAMVVNLGCIAEAKPNHSGLKISKVQPFSTLSKMGYVEYIADAIGDTRQSTAVMKLPCLSWLSRACRIT